MPVTERAAGKKTCERVVLACSAASPTGERDAEAHRQEAYHIARHIELAGLSGRQVVEIEKAAESRGDGPPHRVTYTVVIRDEE